MTGYFCPVEGCDKHHEEWDDDRPPFGSKKAVRSHINAMSDDDHQRAREESIWKDAPEAPVGGDGEGDDEGDESTDEQVESGDEQANDQQNQGDDGSPEEDEQMVSPEEYQKQQDSSDGTEGREGDDDQQTSTDKGGKRRGVVPSLSLPEVPPMYAFAIVAAVFAAIVIWRVMRARSDGPTPTVEDDEQEEETSPNGHTLIE